MLPNIFLLEYNDAIRELRIAESIDNYLGDINESYTNTYARHNSQYMPLKLSTDKFNKYNIILKKSISQLRLPPIKKVSIIILDDSADNGLPHTRANNIICLPVNILKISDTRRNEVLFHECIHIYQRENPIDIESFYKNGWNYIKSTVEPIEGDRINPDAMEVYAINMKDGLWLVRPRFIRKDAAKLTDIRMSYYNLRTGEVTVIMPQEIKQFFGDKLSQSAFEHPNEMMAYIWTNLYYNNLAPITNAEYILKAWLDKYVYNK
jgi:hypothetical protein